jgi:hypothetical protein
MQHLLSCLFKAPVEGSVKVGRAMTEERLGESERLLCGTDEDLHSRTLEEFNFTVARGLEFGWKYDGEEYSVTNLMNSSAGISLNTSLEATFTRFAAGSLSVGDISMLTARLGTDLSSPSTLSLRDLASVKPDEDA